MGSGLTKQVANRHYARDVPLDSLDEEVLTPLGPAEPKGEYKSPRDEKGHEMVPLVRRTIRRKTQTLDRSLKPGGAAMKKCSATLASAPAKGVFAPPIVRKSDAAVKKEGYVGLETQWGTRVMYFRLVGTYLVMYEDEEAESGRPFLPTFVQGIEDLVKKSDNNLEARFISELEKKAGFFEVFTPTRVLKLMAKTSDDQKEWTSLLNAIVESIFEGEELARKAQAQDDLRPLALEQQCVEFMRLNKIVENMVSSGFFDDADVMSHKKGYLKFQRPEYEDEKFYATLIAGAELGLAEKRFTKMFCLLRSDLTIAYARSEKEARESPEGVISLNHLHIDLDHEAIEKSGEMVFSLVTPMRTFVICAPHQVALEEWLRQIARVSRKATNAGNSSEVLAELSSMKVGAGELDLPVVLDNDYGVEVYEKFISGSSDQVTQTVFACWKRTKEFKDLAEFEDESEEAQEQLLTMAKGVAASLVQDPLPSEIDADAQDEITKSVHAGEVPSSINGLRASCLKFLHRSTFAAFKASEVYSELAKQITASGDDDEPAEPIPLGARRMLIYTPNNVAELKARLKKRPKLPTKLKAVGKNSDGSAAFEGWVEIKLTPGTTTETTIGREPKFDLCVDDDRKVSREHGKIDCTPAGECVFADLGSSHGSKVNGKNVSGRVKLAVGDVIKVGKTNILFTIIPAGEKEPLR